MNAVFKRHLVKIDEEAKGRVKQFHVAQELSFVDRENGFHRFGFHDQALIDINIQPEWLFKDEAFVLDGDDQLADTGNLAQEQFAEQALFVNAFQEARALESMDFNRCANGLAGPGIGSFIIGVHEQEELNRRSQRNAKKKAFSFLKSSRFLRSSVPNPSRNPKE